MTSVCFGTAGVPPSGEPGRQRMSARQETIDRYRHFRTIAKQHLGGALKHLSRTAIKEGTVNGMGSGSHSHFGGGIGIEELSKAGAEFTIEEGALEQEIGTASRPAHLLGFVHAA